MAELVDELGLRAWRAMLAAHLVTVARIETDLREHGLIPLVWYDVLVAVQLSPARRLRMRDVAEHLLLTRSNATRLVDRLEAQGLLRRQPAEDDRRGSEVTLMPAGRAALRSAWPVYAAGIRDYFLGQLSDRERQTLAKLLSRVADAAETVPRWRPPIPPRRPALRRTIRPRF